MRGGRAAASPAPAPSLVWRGGGPPRCGRGRAAVPGRAASPSLFRAAQPVIAAPRWSPRSCPARPPRVVPVIGRVRPQAVATKGPLKCGGAGAERAAGPEGGGSALMCRRAAAAQLGARSGAFAARRGPAAAPCRCLSPRAGPWQPAAPSTVCACVPADKDPSV